MTISTLTTVLKEDEFLEVIGFVYGGFCESFGFHARKGTMNNTYIYNIIYWNKGIHTFK